MLSAMSDDRAQQRPTPPLTRRIVKGLLTFYARAWHGATVDGAENLPFRGPVLVLFNHLSFVDIAMLVMADPYPNSLAVAKASIFRVPIVGHVLRAWNCIPVERQGRDTSGVRAILSALKRGEVVSAAPEGRRSRSGRLERLNPVLVRIAMSAGVPIVPLGIAGSFQAMPPGAWFPKPHRVTMKVGPPFTLDRSMGEGEASQRITRAIAALLPPEQQPLSEAETAVGRH
jgi:1-acyl-sn-glycerol-3-phosphate acyltransferase